MKENHISLLAKRYVEHDKERDGHTCQEYDDSCIDIKEADQWRRDGFAHKAAVLGKDIDE